MFLIDSEDKGYQKGVYHLFLFALYIILPFYFTFFRLKYILCLRISVIP